MKPILTRREVMLARGLAVVADLLQWVAFPFFFSGATGIADGVLDVAVFVTLIRLVGWHVAFLPGFVAELLPLVNVVPLWTMAVFFATRGWKEKSRAVEAMPPPPPPPSAPPALDPPGPDTP